MLSPQDAGTSAGNLVKFSIFSSFCSKKGYAQLEVMPSADGWEDMLPLTAHQNDLAERAIQTITYMA
eukprot:14901218-Ditylum_brightwellii.AAC.1